MKKSSNRTTGYVFVVGLTLAMGVYLFVISPMTGRADRKRRAELAMLDVINHGLWSHMAEREQLPTNWLSLTNAVNWEYAIPMCTSNGLPVPTKLYTVLHRPVYYNDSLRTGSIVVVRSEPCRWPGLGLGRWELVVGGYARESSYWRDNSSNQVFRIWIDEKYLPSEIRSQLTNQP